MVCSLDCDTDFFDIVTEVLQGDTLALHMFYNLLKLLTANINRSDKRKYFRIKKRQEADNIHKIYDER